MRYNTATPSENEYKKLSPSEAALQMISGDFIVAPFKREVNMNAHVCEVLIWQLTVVRKKKLPAVASLTISPRVVYQSALQVEPADKALPCGQTRQASLNV